MDYRLYLVDDGGRVSFRIRIGCDDDAHALDISRGAADGCAMELWCGDRLVKAFPADCDSWDSRAPPLTFERPRPGQPAEPWRQTAHSAPDATAKP